MSTEALPNRPVRLTRRVGLSSLRDYGIVICFVALFVALSLSSEAFLTSSNLLNILDQQAAIGIMACAGTLVFIAGGFDLSVGAIYAVSGIVAAKLQPTVGTEAALALGALAGLALGIGNGLLTTVGRINPFIATLSSSIMIRGLAVAITVGIPVSVADPSFATLGRAELLGVKYSVIVWVVFALLCGLVLQHTVLGRQMYAVGGNAEAARLSGIRVGWVRSITYAVSGVAAGLAGVIAASKVATGNAQAGEGVELTVIAAIVVGGVSILGGEGAIWRAMIGVLLLALIGNGFNLLNVDPFYQMIVQGAIIALAVGIDAWTRR
jgi:ribose transport system permease protein